MITSDRIISIIFIFVSILFWSQTQGLQYNCYVFPRILAVFLAALSAIMFVQSFYKKEPAKNEPAKNEKNLPDDVRYIVICLAVVIIWIYLLDILGFIVSSVFFLSVLTLILDLERPTIKRTLYCISVYSVVTFLFWLAFHSLLLVLLPEGYFI